MRVLRAAGLLATGIATLSAAATAQEARLVSSRACNDAARKLAWGRDLTVLPPAPGGILTEVVPYAAFVGGGHEVRVYGNPATPAGIEIGIFGDLAEDPGTRKRCLAYLAQLLLSTQDQKTIGALALSGDRKDVGGMRFQVVAPRTPYDGWWAAAYDPRAVATPTVTMPAWIESTTSDGRFFYAPDPVAVEW